MAEQKRANPLRSAPRWLRGALVLPDRVVADGLLKVAEGDRKSVV